MNQRNLSSAINRLLDVKQDIGDLLSEDPALLTITEDFMSEAIDHLITILYRTTQQEPKEACADCSGGKCTMNCGPSLPNTDPLGIEAAQRIASGHAKLTMELTK